jgi:hypothetical protein
MTYADFMINKPNPPEHAAFMAEAAGLYPTLPPGAQQNALQCLRTLGKGYARRYAANASARQLANERALMGTTLGAHRAALALATQDYRYEGVCRQTAKRAREEAERKARYVEYMAAGKIAAEQKAARGRRIAEKRLAAALQAVAKPATACPTTRPAAAS